MYETFKRERGFPYSSSRRIERGGRVCRKAVWRALRETAVAESKQLFTAVQSSDACSCLQARTLGITRIRYLPKKTGMLSFCDILPGLLYLQSVRLGVTLNQTMSWKLLIEALHFFQCRCARIDDCYAPSQAVCKVMICALQR